MLVLVSAEVRSSRKDDADGFGRSPPMTIDERRPAADVLLVLLLPVTGGAADVLLLLLDDAAVFDIREEADDEGISTPYLSLLTRVLYAAARSALVSAVGFVNAVDVVMRGFDALLALTVFIGRCWSPLFSASVEKPTRRLGLGCRAGLLFLLLRELFVGPSSVVGGDAGAGASAAVG